MKETPDVSLSFQHVCTLLATLSSEMPWQGPSDTYVVTYEIPDWISSEAEPFLGVLLGCDHVRGSPFPLTIARTTSLASTAPSDVEPKVSVHLCRTSVGDAQAVCYHHPSTEASSSGQASGADSPGRQRSSTKSVHLHSSFRNWWNLILCSCRPPIRTRCKHRPSARDME